MLVDEVGAGRVAEQLGRLPVALSQAGAVIGRGRRYPSLTERCHSLREQLRALGRWAGEGAI